MAMMAFYTRFKDLAFKETRVRTVLPGRAMPADEYGFLEFYCDDTRCDCRRVIIKVLGHHSGDKVWATISYGWEAPEFYRKWAGTDLLDAEEMCRPSLDPLNSQSSHATFFLSVFEETIQDKTYVERLQRHYAMFRQPAKRRGKLLRQMPSRPNFD